MAILAPSRIVLRAAAPVLAAALLATACAPGQVDTRLQPDMAADEQVDSLKRVAAMTLQSGDTDTAVTLYRRIHELDPRDPDPLIELARIMEARGAPADALLLWQDAAVLAPEDPAIAEGYGLALARLGQAGPARSQLERATASAPTPRAWNALGVVRDQLGDAEGAQTAYRAGLAVAPADSSLANNLGLSLALSEQYGEALERLEAVAVLPDAGVRYRRNLALAYVLSGDFERAVDTLAVDGDRAGAQLWVTRYTGITDLPDHASRVAAVAAAGTVPQQAASASPENVPERAARQAVQQEALSLASEPRVTPLIDATRTASQALPVPLPKPVLKGATPTVQAKTDAASPSIETRLNDAARAYDTGDYEEAAGIWRPLADDGVVQAQFHLGSLYFEGRGVPRDLMQAYTLLRQAELAGFADARVILSLVEPRLSATERNEAEAQMAAARS
jgi:Flp pilus assembly protein TadD